MRNASPELKASMKEAKASEVKTWVENEVCIPIVREKLTREPLKVRWILAIKKDTGKAKARMVALGFQDADLGKVKTESPTASRRARSMYLQQTVNASWHMMKADAKGAFLQGKELKREVSIIPTPELAEAYNLKPHELLLLRKAVYGLIDAPKEWYDLYMRHFWKWDG